MTDFTGKAVIWSCSNRSFEDQPETNHRGFVKAKLENVNFYSVYAPPSLDINEFMDLLDRLVEDAEEHSLCAIAEDFNAWAIEWGSKKRTKKETSSYRQCHVWT